MGIGGFFRIPRPSEAVSTWNTSPGVDTCAYAFSWLWVLVPLVLFAGNDPKPPGGQLDVAYVGLYLLILAATDVHRHYTIPLVYLDKEVRQQFPARFLFLPVVLLALWAASPVIAAQKGVLLSITVVTAVISYALVLIQIVRRDGGVGSIRTRESIALLVPLALANGLSFGGIGIFASVDPAWWWVAAALGSSAYLDLRLSAGASDRYNDQTTDSLAHDGMRPTPFVGTLIIAVLAAATYLWGPAIDTRLPRGGISPRQLVNLVAFIAFVWNLWHFYMQKYGFLRMYNAKSQATVQVPGYVDRLLVFCWLPLYFVYLVPQYRGLAMRKIPKGREYIAPLADAMERVSAYLTPIATTLVVAVIVLWLRAEWKSNRFKNRPRLTMALGTSLMAGAFLVVDPMKAYLAFAFSHSLEYMVFVWAYQRRRYQRSLDHAPLLGKILRHPVLAYGLFTLVLAAIFIYLKYYGRYIFPQQDRPQFLGFRTSTWIAYWGIYQSMAHFYWDGFMWKIRHKSVRKHL